METQISRETMLVAGAVLLAALLIRLWRLGLTGRYPIVTFGVAFSALRMSVEWVVSRWDIRLFGYYGYGLVYVVSSPVVWGFYFLIVLELYSSMLEEFPGLRRLGRLVMFSALAALAVACCLVITLDQQAGVESYPVLAYLALQERSVYLCLSTLTLLLVLFVAHYRLSVRRNVWVLCGCFGGYFVASAVILSLRWYFGSDFKPVRNLTNAAFYDAALLGAVLLVSRAGESEKRPISVVWGGGNRDLELAMSLRLQSFNQTLVKVLRQ